MAGLSDYAESGILNALLRGTTFVAPATAALRMGLFVADPTDAGTLNEVATGTWYARKVTGDWNAPSTVGGAQQSSNIAAITFNAVSGAAATITHIGIFDALTGGNMLFSAPLTSSKTLQIGDVLSFAPGQVVIQLD